MPSGSDLLHRGDGEEAEERLQGPVHQGGQSPGLQPHQNVQQQSQKV